MPDWCIICDKIVSPVSQRMHTDKGFICADCVSKGEWEKYQDKRQQERDKKLKEQLD